MADILTPFVYWAQTEQQITLKVDLTDTWRVKVNMNENKLRVTVYGQGARGLNEYGFSLDLHSSINVEESNYKVTARQVDFTLGKKCPAWWPRLTSQPQKPSWLKIDFDKWTSEDLDDNEDERRDVCSDYPDMYDKLHEEEFGYRKEDFKKVYLIIYNLCQFVGFIYILTVMGIMYSRDGPASMKETYIAVGNAMKFIQLIQFLEVMHSLFGYTKSSTFVTFVQVGGRAFILFIMIEAEPRMQTKPVVFYLFLVWSTVEVFRMSVLVQYVVVRGDLLETMKWPIGAIVAQACHACTAVTHLFYNDNYTQAYLANLDAMHKIVLEVPDETSLNNLCLTLTNENIDHKLWIEQPDNIPTCLATKPYPKDKVKSYFKKYKLLKL